MISALSETKYRERSGTGWERRECGSGPSVGVTSRKISGREKEVTADIIPLLISVFWKLWQHWSILHASFFMLHWSILAAIMAVLVYPGSPRIICGVKEWMDEPAIPWPRHISAGAFRACWPPAGQGKLREDSWVGSGSPSPQRGCGWCEIYKGPK